MFTTVAILNLVEDETIQLDDPIINYIPDFVMADERYKDITVRMLLNHSSGFMTSELGNAFLYADVDTTYHNTLLDELKTKRLKTAPGELSSYCNVGFTMAEILIERVSGLSFTDYIHQNITEPLELNNTKTPQDNFNFELVAKSGVPTYMGNQALDVPTEVVNAIGTGGLYSNAEDLCQFGTIFLEDGILEQSSIDLTKAPEYLRGIWHGDEKAMMEYGLGWDTIAMYPFDEQGIQVLSKGGDTLTSHASLVVSPEHNIVVAVLSAGGASTFNQCFAGQILLDELLKEDKIQLPNYTDILPPQKMIDIPAKFLQYEGVYINNALQAKIDFDTQGTLEISMPSIPVQRYLHQGDGIFISEYGGSYIEFVSEKNGHNYLKLSSIVDTGLIPLRSTVYNMQQITPVTIDAKVKSSWENRLGKKYYTVDFKYTSLSYTTMLPVAVFPEEMPIEGYFSNLKIEDENNLKTKVQIPQNDGRDVQDMHFYTEDGVEYIQCYAGLVMGEEGVKNFASGKYTIDKYAEYFKVNEGEHSLTVNIEGNGMFAVYNEFGLCIYSSIIEPNRTIALPIGGMVVIAGDSGTTFNIM